LNFNHASGPVKFMGSLGFSDYGVVGVR
jgi:hypothetical protein